MRDDIIARGAYLAPHVKDFITAQDAYEATCAFYAKFGGGTVYVPSLRHALRPAVAVLAADLHDAGYPSKRVADMVGYAPQSVAQLINDGYKIRG